MTLKTRAYLFSSLILIVLALLFLLNHYQRLLYASLLETVQVLDRVKHIAHRMEIDTLARRTDSPSLQRLIKEIPLLFAQLAQGRESREIGTETELVGLGLAFIRLERLAGNMLRSRAGTIPGPLLEQLHNEVGKIEQAVAGLQEYLQTVINAKRRKILLLQQTLYPLALVFVLFFLAAILRSSLYPILALSRQMQEVSEGRRATIDLPPQEDEVGRLARCTNDALVALAQQRQDVEAKQRQLSEILRRQEALSQILRLQLSTATVEELLDGTLAILLSLEWLTLESKGGVFLVDSDQPSRLRLVVHRNFPPEAAKLCATVSFGHCLCGQAAAERRLVYAARCTAEHTVVYPEMTEHGHYCVPILFGSTLLGVMVFYLPPGHGRREDEARFLSDVANLLAEAVNRRLLEERQRLIFTAVDQAREGIVISDRHGRIRYANLFAAALADCDLDDLYRRSLRCLLSGLDDELYAELIAQVEGGATWRTELTVSGPDGRRFVDQLTAAPIVHPVRGLTHYLITWEDESEAHELRRQLMRSQRLEAVGRFTSGIVHDFNNIVSSILGFAQIGMQDLPPEDPLREHFQVIVDAGRKANALIRQLLAFSRRQPLELSRFDLGRLVEELSEMLQRLLGSRIELQVMIDEGAVPVDGDPGQIEQVVMNLVLNARDAMPGGGRITIQVGKEALLQPVGLLPSGRYAMLRVADTGEGIPEAIRDKIFDPFFTTKKEGEGTGLGLATVYGIVQQHHGQIQVASVVGQGTTFTIHLPLAADNQGPPVPPPSDAPG